VTIDELRAACREGDYVSLLLPPPNGQGYTRRLCGRVGPRGEIIGGRPERGQTVRFRSDEVLKYLDKMEAAEAAGKEE
jgi:hypothetical protein